MRPRVGQLWEKYLVKKKGVGIFPRVPIEGSRVLRCVVIGLEALWECPKGLCIVICALEGACRVRRGTKVELLTKPPRIGRL